MKKPDDPFLAAQQFAAPYQTIVLATTDADSTPHASYAPFVVADQCLYVFVSQLAAHSRTLLTGKVTALMIEDEQQAKNLFARKRLTLSCTVSAVDNNSVEGIKRIDQLERERGNTVSVLRSLPDFQLFQLQPVSALFVTGFGAAFDISDRLNELWPAQK